MKLVVLLSWSLSCICISAAMAQAPSHPKQWPKVLKGRGSAKVISPTSDVAPFVYKSRNFQFISDKKIESTKIAKFAATAESVPAAVGRIPIELLSLPSLKEGVERHSIYIPSSVDEFIKMGGSAKSAGYYSGKDRTVYLRADKFIEVKRPDYRLLTHELVHLTMHGINGKCNAWFSEGNAEYFACAFYGTSSYKFSSMPQNIRARTQWFFKKGEPLRLHALEEFVTRDSEAWREVNSDLPPEDRYSQYMTALLLVHYFYHIAPDGRKQIQHYLRLMQEGRKDVADQAHLFPAGETANIEKALTNYWKPRGYRILFEDYGQ